MQHVHAHFIVRKLQQRLFDRFDGALHVALDNDVQTFDLTFGDLAEHIVQRHARLRLDHGFALFALALVGDLLHQLILFNGNDGIASVRDFFQAENGNSHGRASRFDRSALIVDHGADSADRRTGDHIVARMQRTVLNEHGRDGTFAFIQLCFDDRAACRRIGIRGEFFDFRNEIDRFK